MSIPQPTDLPGQSSRESIPVIARVQPLAALAAVPDDFAARMAAISDNRIAVETLISLYDLPHGSLTARPELVHVSVEDLDDVARWMGTRGGESRVSPPFEGVRLYVLDTHTDARADGSRVLVRVSCAVPVEVTR